MFALIARITSMTKRAGMRILLIFSSPWDTPLKMMSVAPSMTMRCQGTIAPGVLEKAAHRASESRPGLMTPVMA